MSSLITTASNPTVTGKRKRGKPQLTEEEKVQIIELAAEGSLTKSQIATLFNRNKKTIKRVVKAGTDGIPRKLGTGNPRGTKQLVFSGAGTQAALTASKTCGSGSWNEETVSNIYSVDALLDSLSGTFKHSFAHISLNVTFPFHNTFHFHGTVPGGTVVPENKTQAFAAAALEWLWERWAEDTKVHLTIIGLGLTSRMGSVYLISSTN